MEINYEQILQLIGAKELDICALKLRVAELEKQNAVLVEAENSEGNENKSKGRQKLMDEGKAQ